MTKKTNGLKTKLWRNATGCCKGTEQVDAVSAGPLSFNFTISPYSRLYADGLAVGLIEVVTACFICLVFSIVPDNDMVRRFALTWTSSTWRISRSTGWSGFASTSWLTEWRLACTEKTAGFADRWGGEMALHAVFIVSLFRITRPCSRISSPPYSDYNLPTTRYTYPSKWF